MSLKDSRCDRCRQRSGSLFRLEADMQKPSADNPWYCPNCMRLMGQPLDPETLRLMRVLRELNDQKPQP